MIRTKISFLFLLIFMGMSGIQCGDFDSNDPFEVLGINDRNMAIQNIKKVYHQLSLKNHLDRGGSSENFKKINAAWKILEEVPTCGKLPKKLLKFIVEIAKVQPFGIKDILEYSGIQDELNKGDRNITKNIEAFLNVHKSRVTYSVGELNKINLVKTHPDLDKDVKKIFLEYLQNSSIKNSRNNLYSARPNLLQSLDIINSLIELYKISVLGSCDESSIARAAKIDRFKHNLSKKLGLPSSIVFGIYRHVRINPAHRQKSLLASAVANVMPSLAVIKFSSKDNEIIKNQKEIAAYNKASNRSLFKEKIIQTGWLALNKILPYAVFSYSRVKNDKAKYSEIFDPSHLINNLEPAYKLEVWKALSNLSEIARKHYRYKAEMGDYKSFVKKLKEEGRAVDDILLAQSN